MTVDVSCFPDLDFANVSGRRALAEALARRIQTPRGSLFYAPDYGIDVREMLGMRVSEWELFRWKAAIEREILRDERVLSVSADLTYTPLATASTGRFQVEVLVETEEEGTIGWGLVLSGDGATIGTGPLPPIITSPLDGSTFVVG